jgi:hypothetical protein
MTVLERPTILPARIYPNNVCLHTMQRCAPTQRTSEPAALQTYRIGPRLALRTAFSPLETADSSLPGSQRANGARLKAHR